MVAEDLRRGAQSSSGARPVGFSTLSIGAKLRRAPSDDLLDILALGWVRVRAATIIAETSRWVGTARPQVK
jgi:hypothetical protein